MSLNFIVRRFHSLFFFNVFNRFWFYNYFFWWSIWGGQNWINRSRSSKYCKNSKCYPCNRLATVLSAEHAPIPDSPTTLQVPRYAKTTIRFHCMPLSSFFLSQLVIDRFTRTRAWTGDPPKWNIYPVAQSGIFSAPFSIGDTGAANTAIIAQQSMLFPNPVHLNQLQACHSPP